MNKNELKAIILIANKMNWQSKPLMEVCETIKQMIRNQQALEIDCIGECDDEEDTLLSIALWDTDKVTSILLSDVYQSLVFESVKDQLFIPMYEAEDAYEEYLDGIYYATLETQLSCRY